MREYPPFSTPPAKLAETPVRDETTKMGHPILSRIWLHAYGGASRGLLAPECDLPEGLSESVYDDGGLAVAEALDGEVGGLFGVVGGVPQADHDAIVGQVQADALADGARLREGEGGESRDEDDGVGLVGE